VSAASVCTQQSRLLYYFMIRHAAATRVVSLFYLTPPVTACFRVVRRETRAARARWHGGLRRRRFSGELAAGRLMGGARGRHARQALFVGRVTVLFEPGVIPPLREGGLGLEMERKRRSSRSRAAHLIRSILLSPSLVVPAPWRLDFSLVP
jgi:hypothetical protein